MLQYVAEKKWRNSRLAQTVPGLASPLANPGSAMNINEHLFFLCFTDYVERYMGFNNEVTGDAITGVNIVGEFDPKCWCL